MRSQLTPQSIANSVRFSRSGKPASTALLLEGCTDIKLYRNLIDATRCEIYAVDGKDRAFQVLLILETSRVPGVVAILDADCDHLAGTVSTKPNVITTETRDIEGLLIGTSAFEKVLNEHNLPLHISGTSTRDLVLRAARTLGYIRWLAFQNNWSLDFKCLSFGAFIDPYKITASNSTHAD